MNTWWYYYYSALLQINWNCHKALKSISPNPVLLHSCVLKSAAAVWQFSLDSSTCPKTGTLCVKVGPKPAFIPLSNSCIQSYNSPGLLVEYIINMQQDLSALFSQSLGASSNSENKNCATVVENCLYFYCSDHDLCLFFNEVLDKPRCQWFDLHKISKNSFTWSSCQVTDCSCQTRVSRQTCIKIESCDICLWRITFARQRSTIVDVSSYWLVLPWDIQAVARQIGIDVT